MNVVCSRPENGSISDPSLVPEGDLASVRTRELQEAAKILGVTELLILDHPDGDLRWAHVPQLHAEIVAAVERYRPDAVITFAEDGYMMGMKVKMRETMTKKSAKEASHKYEVDMGKGFQAVGEDTCKK